jgi:hypothetical protein
MLRQLQGKIGSSTLEMRQTNSQPPQKAKFRKCGFGGRSLQAEIEFLLQI